MECEVKNGEVISASDLRGLKEFPKDYPEATLLLLHRGKETFKRDGVLCIPAEEFLRRPNPVSKTLYSEVHNGKNFGKAL